MNEYKFNGYDTSDISLKLREFRIMRNMKQKDLAAYLGCKPETVCRWEKYKVKPSGKWVNVMRERGIM